MFDYGLRATKPSGMQICTPEAFNSLVDDAHVAAVCAEIEDLREKKMRGEITPDEYHDARRPLKMQLPVFTFHAHYNNGYRKNANAVPSGLSIFDIDGMKQDPEQFYKERVAAREKELGIVLAHVSPSLEGLHLVFVTPQGMTLAQAQKWLANEIKTEYDSSTKDDARCSYVVPRSYILFINEAELFKERDVTLNVQRGTGNDNTQNSKDIDNTSSKNIDSETNIAQPSTLNVQRFNVQRSIFQLCRQSAGLSKVDIETRGNRHTSLLSILSQGLPQLMSLDEALAVVAHEMPKYWNDPAEAGNAEKLVKDFYANYAKSGARMTEKMQQIWAKSIAEGDALANLPESADWDVEESTPTSNQPQAAHIDTSILPIGLRDSLENLPKEYQMAALVAALTIAAAYADDVEYTYCDGNVHRTAIMGIVVGPQASGKSVCKNIVAEWSKKMDEEDAVSRRIEEEWKQKRKGRRANEKAEADPAVLIRKVPITISCSTLLKRLKNSRGHCLYSFCEEMDTLLKSNGAGSWSSKYDVYRLAFDSGEWGQDYNSDQAESGVTLVHYNWCILGTYGALHKCFKSDNVENGLSSRMLIATMPDNSFAQMPHFTQLSSEQKDNIQAAVEKLSTAHGMLDVPALRKAIAEWVEEKRKEAAKDLDYVKDTYRKRAAVIGFRCGVIAHILSGSNTETHSTITFATTMAQYALEEQIKLFGDAFKRQMNNDRVEPQRRGINNSIFDQLPEKFTINDLHMLKPESTQNTLSVVIHRWKRDGWIQRIRKNEYKKL